MFTFFVSGSQLHFAATQEAKEVLADAEGRWLSFNIGDTDLIILEKKGLPEHLQAIENLDITVSLQSLLCDLQDAGEVTFLNIWIIPRLEIDIPILLELTS